MAVITGILGGCAADKKETTSKKEIKMAGILMQSDIEWFKYIQAGMEDAAEKYNVDLVIGNAEMQVLKESDLVDTYAAQGMDAIMLSALDSEASIPALERANEKGVKIINYNTVVNSDVMKQFVGIDNFQLGAQMGKYVADYVVSEMGGKAKVAMVTISMFEVGIQRAEGFLSETKKVPGIEIVAEQDAADPVEGASVVETIIQANDDLDIIWAANDGGAMGAIVGVNAKNKNSQIKIFGTDMSLQAANALLDENNPLFAVSTQQPYEIGYYSVEQAVKAINGDEFEAEVIVPLDMYDKKDIKKVNDYLEKFKDL